MNGGASRIDCGNRIGLIKAWPLTLLAGVMALAVGCSPLEKGSVPIRKLQERDRVQPQFGIPAVSLVALARTQTQPFRINAGDVLTIGVGGLAEGVAKTEVTARVNRSGNLILPLVGMVKAGNLTLDELEAAIGQAFVDHDIVVRPEVLVQVVEAKGYFVSVTGGVAQPGLYELPRENSDVLAALSRAGGLTPEAGPEIEVVRAGTGEVLRLDLLDPESVVKAGEKLWLHNRDLVRVLPWPENVVYMTGLVNGRGPQRLPRDRPLDLVSAIGMAGGVDPVSQPSHVVVIRMWWDEKRKTRRMTKIFVDLEKASVDPNHNILLKHQDYVAVVHDANSFLREMAANSVRFGIGAQINVADPDYYGN